MTLRSQPFTALLAALVLVVIGCSGGAGAEEYFTDLERATSKLDGELDAVEAEFNAGLLDIDFESPAAEDALIALFTSSISTTAASFDTLVTALERLEPPPDVAASHDDAVRAGAGVLAAYEERTDELAAISRLSDIDAYAQSLSETEVRARFTEACRELQAHADASGVVVDLGC